MSGPITTNWCVLTGAAAAGKSTVLNELAKLGYLTVHETARSYLEQQLAKGASIADLTRDQLKFQKNLLALMSEVERKLDPDVTTFLDRALGDGVGFFLAAGLDPAEVLGLCNTYRYLRVFLLEQVPDVFLSVDPFRFRTKQQNTALEHFIEEGYMRLGYRVARVPFGSVEERVSFMLDELRGVEA